MPLYTKSATELRALLERGEITSVEIVDALYARGDAVDGSLHASVRQLRKQALADAAARDEERRRGELRGPLHGLPVTIKENIAVAGTDATAGMRSRLGKPSERDAVTVALARESGAVVIAKSNVPQTLIAAETVSFIHPRTNNPWSVLRTPGGSSGGEAAMIASGQSALGIGTDIGGSIRIPAHFSGICGMKPTLHRWSNTGSTGAMPGQEFVRSQIGPMARTTDDLTLLLRSLDSPRHAALDPEVAPVPLGDPAHIDVSKLRIGYYEDDGFLSPSLAVGRAVREAVATLKAAGAELVPYRPTNVHDGYFLYVAGMSADGLRTLERELAGEPLVSPLKAFERIAKLAPLARKALAKGLEVAGETRLSGLVRSLREKTVYELFELNARKLAWVRDEANTWRDYGLDAVICPPYATPAAQHDATGDFSAGAYYAFRYNVLGNPAGVVPVTRVRENETSRFVRKDRIDERAAKIDEGSAGLPIGVQVVARHFREDVVLAVMKAIEMNARRASDYPRSPIDPRS
jgi:fatty acid amide hydrolase